MASYLPEEYVKLSLQEIDDRITAQRKRYGKDLVILGHYYQRYDVIKHSDFQGDSLDLSDKAAHSQARHIVFCGVHFMAESATILVREDQAVYLPNLFAGCPMADMGDSFDVEHAWEEISSACHEKIIPITYMNSTAALKAFCGKHNGAVCTSSNASALFKYYFQNSADKIFFFPDEHLGRNTALEMGITEEEMIVWDPTLELGGNTLKQIVDARLVLWKGYCHVHTFFRPEHIRMLKAKYPDALVVVHPECTREVVEMADACGSTSFIKKFVEDAPSESTIIVGTEINHALNLDIWNKDKKVIGLARSFCPNMYKINPQNLLWTLDHLNTDEVHRIRVPERIRENAKKALSRMLEVRGDLRQLHIRKQSAAA